MYKENRIPGIFYERGESLVNPCTADTVIRGKKGINLQWEE